MSDKQIGAHFKYYQINTHVQAARESLDLKIDFRSFDNGFKQLCVTNFMQVWRLAGPTLYGGWAYETNFTNNSYPNYLELKEVTLP